MWKETDTRRPKRGNPASPVCGTAGMVLRHLRGAPDPNRPQAHGEDRCLTLAHIIAHSAVRCNGRRTPERAPAARCQVTAIGGPSRVIARRLGRGNKKRVIVTSGGRSPVSAQRLGFRPAVASFSPPAGGAPPPPERGAGTCPPGSSAVRCGIPPLAAPCTWPDAGGRTR